MGNRCVCVPEFKILDLDLDLDLSLFIAKCVKGQIKIKIKIEIKNLGHLFPLNSGTGAKSEPAYVFSCYFSERLAQLEDLKLYLRTHPCKTLISSPRTHLVLNENTGP